MSLRRYTILLNPILHQNIFMILIMKSKFFVEIVFINLYSELFSSIFSSTFSRVVISFTEEQFIPQKRSESQSLIDILANAGGLFGLFMGASLLSFAELAYYLTLRIFFMRRQENNLIRREVSSPDHVFPFLPWNFKFSHIKRFVRNRLILISNVFNVCVRYSLRFETCTCSPLTVKSCIPEF